MNKVTIIKEEIKEIRFHNIYMNQFFLFDTDLYLKVTDSTAINILNREEVKFVPSSLVLECNIEIKILK